MTITREYFRDCKHLYDVLDMFGYLRIRMFKDPDLDTGKERGDMVVGDYDGSSITLGYDSEKDMLEYNTTDWYISGIDGTAFSLTPKARDTVEYKNLDEVLDDVWCNKNGYGITNAMNGYPMSTPKAMDTVLDAWSRRWDSDTGSVDVLRYKKDWLGNDIIWGAYRVRVYSSYDTFSIEVEDLVSEEMEASWEGAVGDFIELLKNPAKYMKVNDILSKMRDDIDAILGDE